MIKFLDLNTQYQSIKPEIDAAIAAVIEESAFIGGRHVRQFEEDFGNWVGSSDCIGVANGTDALEIAIEALGLPADSEIIVPANSFIATSEAVGRAGHKIVFADVDPHSYTLTAETVRDKLSVHTKAIIAVHLYGHPCDMDEIMGLAGEYGIKVIEDSAQAHGAECRGRKVGTLGDVATFSFYPGKNLGAYGDAGAITTSDIDLARRMRMIANHGRVAKYDQEFEGRNSRLDGMQAAILSVKLKHLDAWTNKRIALADRYLEVLSGFPELTLPIRKNWAKQVYHLFVVRTERRDELAKHLGDRGIQTGVHYPIALPKLPAYRKHPQAKEDMFACRSDRELLSLPIGEHMSNSDIDRVADAIGGFFPG